MATNALRRRKLLLEVGLQRLDAAWGCKLLLLEALRTERVVG
jgi:hypothetical protein